MVAETREHVWVIRFFLLNESIKQILGDGVAKWRADVASRLHTALWSLLSNACWGLCVNRVSCGGIGDFPWMRAAVSVELIFNECASHLKAIDGALYIFTYVNHSFCWSATRTSHCWSIMLPRMCVMPVCLNMRISKFCLTSLACISGKPTKLHEEITEVEEHFG